MSFWIPGVPVPQGSKKLIRHDRRGRPLARPRLVEDAKGHAAWRRVVAQVAMLVACGHPFAADHEVIGVRLHFYFRRPKRPKRWAPHEDCDKLARAVCDGLTEGALLINDSQVKPLIIDKDYGTEEGVQVTLFRTRKGEGYATTGFYARQAGGREEEDEEAEVPEAASGRE